jgi:uncharacterized protein YecE (DUF72 family)
MDSATVIGTSGFFYREWRGVFYPPDLPMNKWLSFYSEHFNGLEINSTFYRLPKKTSLKRFKREGKNLKFVLKLFRGITHFKKLTDENVKPFYEAKEIFGDSLICLLAQFPKSFSPSEENLNYLNAIYEKFVKEGIHVAFELRDPKWENWLGKFPFAVVCNHFPDKLQWLKKCKEDEYIHYFRFHGTEGLYRGNHPLEELKSVALQMKKSSSRFKVAFFNNTSKAAAVKDALQLQKLL